MKIMITHRVGRTLLSMGMALFTVASQILMQAIVFPVHKNTREFARVYFSNLDSQLRSCSSCRRGRSSGRSFYSRSCGTARLVENGDDVVRKIEIIGGVHQKRDTVNAHARLIEYKIEMIGFDLLHHNVGDFLYDSFAHAHQLLLQLPFTRLAEIADLLLHSFDFCDLIITILRRLRFLIRAESW